MQPDECIEDTTAPAESFTQKSDYSSCWLLLGSIFTAPSFFLNIASHKLFLLFKNIQYRVDIIS